MRLSTKLPSVIVGLSILAVCIAGFISFTRSEEALEIAAFDKLEAVQKGRIAELQSFLKSIEDDLQAISTNDMTIKGLTNFQRAFYSFETPEVAAQELHELYVVKNPETDKSKYMDAGDGSNYSKTHKHYHPWFKNFLDGRGYADILLLNDEGSVIYSVQKGNDFGQNLITGDLKNTDLAAAFNAVKDKEKGAIFFSDIKAYPAANNSAASFLSSPVFDKRDNFMGTLVMSLPIQRINHIMQASAGMGETGEAYLVGVDFMMRSDSRFTKEQTILKRKISTEPARMALSGKDEVMVADNADGVEVLSAFGPITFQDITWAVMAEITMDEVDIPIIEMRNILLLMIVVLVAVIGVIGISIARTITKPVASITRVMGELADNNLNVDVPYTDKTDEIGEMAVSVNHFKDQMARVKELEEEQVEQKRKADAQRKAAMVQMANSFEESVGAVVQTVTSAATQLQASASEMSATATQTSSQAMTVASASEEAAANVETVASAAEELAASEQEISRHVHRSSEVADFASTQASETKNTVENMVEEVGKIGAVVKLISDIAEQTNMLALNATIEAARAGVAGKGFAVVASEVKNLANQTGKATEEIASQIAKVQNVTQESAQAIENISNTITEIDEIANAIKNSVEQQNAATKEIATNVDQASQGTQEVSKNIQSVQQAANETGMAANQISDSSSDLSKQAEVLREEVKRFLDEVRSDNSEKKILEWDECYRTGDAQLDSEHMAFMDLLNTYYAKMMAGEGASVIADTLVKFADMSKEHMIHEESLMDNYNYPKADQHKTSHQEFSVQFLKIQESHDNGNDVSVDFLEYLSEWLKDHFLNADKHLVDYIREQD